MSETNLNQFEEVAPAGTLTLRNSSLLKVRLEGDSAQAKLGSMVAHRVRCGSITRVCAVAFDGSSAGG